MEDWHELTLEQRIDRLANAIVCLERLLEANNINYPAQQIPGYDPPLQIHVMKDPLSLDRRYGVYGSALAKNAKSCNQE